MWAENRPDISDDSAIQSWLQEAIEEANAVICKRSADQKLKGCSTIVAAVHSNNKVHVAHVGDSRAYRLRDGELKALTDDHRVSTELVKAGKMTREQVAGTHFCKDFLTRAVGFDEEIAVDKTAFVVRPGDWLLLCTDGLYVCLSDERIAEILCGCATPQDACSQLLAHTIEAGAPDNIALVVTQYI
jgi:protein phosphatase